VAQEVVGVGGSVGSWVFEYVVTCYFACWVWGFVEVDTWSGSWVYCQWCLPCSHIRAAPPTIHVPTAQIWRKDVPLKVSVFAWHIFRNRFPSKTTCFEEASSLSRLSYVSRVVGIRNQSHIFFWHVLFLVSYGTWLGTDSVFFQQIHLIFRIIFICSVHFLVLPNLDTL